MNKTQIKLFGDKYLKIKNDNFSQSIDFQSLYSSWYCTTNSGSTNLVASGWTQSNNTIHHTTGLTYPLIQHLTTNILLTDTEYEVIIKIKNRTTGSIIVGLNNFFGNTISTTNSINDNGVYYETVTFVNTVLVDYIKLIPSNDFNGEIEFVKVKSKFNYKYYNLELDGFNEFELNLNFQTTEISDVSKRASTYSKTINVNSTQNNDNIFQYLFDVNLHQDEVNNYLGKARPASIFYDTLPIRHGQLYLEKINRDINNKIVSYEVKFNSDNVSLALLAGNNYLWNNDDKFNDIDVSDLNHTFNRDYIISTWHTGTTGVYYPITSTDNIEASIFPLYNFRPCIFAVELFDRIMDKYELEYTSNFLNSEIAKNLIIPWTGELSKSDIQIQFEKVSVTLTTTPGTFSVATDANIKVDWSTKIEDDSNSFDLTTDKWTCPNDGKYSFKSALGFSINTIGITSFYTFTTLIHLKLIRERNGVFVILQDNNMTYEMNENFTFYTLYLDIEAELITNDKVYIDFNIDGPYYYTIGTSTAHYNFSHNLKFWGSDSFFKIEPVNGNFYEGCYVDMSRMFQDKKIKQIDFVSNFFNLFNLQIEEDNKRPGTFIIEPRPDYLLSGNTYDWTDKVTGEITIQKISEDVRKNYLFTYTEDSDYLNNKYKLLEKETYGQYLFINEVNSKDKVEIKSFFSPTPLTQKRNKLPVSGLYECSENDPPEYTLPPLNIRILNKQLITPPTESNSDFVIVDNNFNFYYILGIHGFYPYSGHYRFDSNLKPIFDLNFGQCNRYFFNQSGSTINNLYNLYWKDYIDGLTDINSKLVTMYINLSINDILNFNFNDRIFIDNTWYLVNKIIDWNPNQICKIELLKMGNGPYRSVINKIPRINSYHRHKRYLDVPKENINYGYIFDVHGNIAYSGVTNDDGKPVDPFLQENYIADSSNAIVSGRNNIVNGSTNTIITGDNNTIESYRDNVIIIGKNNLIK